MSHSLRVLIVEDREEDALLEIEELKRNDFDPQWERVETAEQMKAALDRVDWDIILVDWALPHLNGSEALHVAKSRDVDVPFIVVSGTIGEEAAVEAMREGARDFVLKDKLWRLGPTVQRALAEAEIQRERVRAEKALHDSERRYRSLVEQASDAIVVADQSGTIVEANSSAVRLSGYDIGDVGRRRLSDLVDPEELRLRPISPLMTAGESIRSRRTLVRKDGERVPVDLTATVLDDGRMLAIVRDMSEQLKMIEALRRSEFAMAEAQRIAHVGSWCWHVDEDWFEGSDETRRLLGIGPTEMPSSARVLELMAPESREAGRKIMQAHASGANEQADLTIVRPDGERRFVHTQGEPGRDSDGKGRLVFGYLQDITEKKLAEIDLQQTVMRLRESETKLARAQRIAHVGSWTWHIDADWFEASDEAYRIMGIPPQSEHPNTPRIMQFVAPESVEVLRHMMDGLVAGYQRETDLTVLLPDGQRRFIHTSGEPDRERTPGKRLAFGYIQDVTEKRIAEMEIFRREQEFKALVEGSPDVISRFDRDGRVVYVSPAVTRMTGIPPQQWIGRTNVDLGFTEVHATVESAVRKVFQSGSEVVFEFRSNSAEGPRVFQGRMVPELGPSGRVEYAISIVRDITELRDTVSRLRKNEEQLSRAQRIAGIGSWELDLQTGERTWTEQLFRIMRLPLAEPPTEEAIYERIHPEDRDVVRAAHDQAIATGEKQVAEHRMTIGDGSEQIFVVHIEPSKDASGKVARLTGTVQNVTALRRTEESLRESEKRLRDFVETANDAIVTLDRMGRIVDLNPAVTRITGHSPSAVLGRPLVEFMHPDDTTTVSSGLRSVLESGGLAVVDGRVRTAAGNYVDLEATASRQPGKGSPAVFVIARDVTDRRRAEAERTALMREIQLLLESTYEGIIALDLAGRCTLVNRAACAMLGYAPEQLLGGSVHDRLHHHTQNGSLIAPGACRITAIEAGSRPDNILNETLWRADGTSFPVEILTSPMLDENGETKGIVISFTDATEKQLLHDELERANRLTSLGRVAATMSHEFNNVLMGIQPFAEILGRKSTDEKVLDAARHIKQSVQRGRRVTQEVLRFTRPAEPMRKPVCVRKWLSDCATELRGLVPPNVRIDVDVVPQSLTAELDREQMTQVVSNMVLNARDALGESDGTITISARQPVDTRFSFGVIPEAQKFVHLCIRDNGPGIAPADLPRVFEPFFTMKKSGTGLGLAVAHQVVRLHGGHIFAESSLGVGTAFHVFVPAALVAETSAADPPSRERRALPRRVLVVEDEESVRIGIASLLENESILVDAVTSGAEALRYLQTQQPDALILDVGLPDANGVDIYEQVRRTTPWLPVVFSSGYADRARIEALSQHAPVRLLHKPYDGGELLEALEEACETMV